VIFIENQPFNDRLSEAGGYRTSYHNCIVLYLYIYIALVAVHTNQKRFPVRETQREESSLERTNIGTRL